MIRLLAVELLPKSSPPIEPMSKRAATQHHSIATWLPHARSNKSGAVSLF
jgi:hypothetical protein